MSQPPSLYTLQKCTSFIIVLKSRNMILLMPLASPLIKVSCILIPAGSQIDLDRYLQNSSSQNKMELILSLTFRIWTRLSRLFIAVSISNSLYFSSSIDFEFPRVLLHPTKDLRHCLILLNKLYIGLPELVSLFQASKIIFSHSGWVDHFSLNCFGIFFLLEIRPVSWVESKIGSWSEQAAWR